MPRRVLYCRHDDCLEAYVSEQGYVPHVCPACNRAGHWTTERPTTYPPESGYPADPKRPYRLSMKDRDLLKSLRIVAEDDTDHEDGA